MIRFFWIRVVTFSLCLGVSLNAADRKNEANAIPILTVCEALRDRGVYSNRTVIIVGRSSGTDEGSWLNENCGLRLLIAERVYPVAISTSYSPSQSLPPIAPPPKKPKGFRWDKRRLQQVLEAVKKTTRLEYHTESYAAVYGRLESEVPRKLELGDGRTLIFNGYGHLGEAPAQLIWPDKGGYLKLAGK